MLDSNIALHFDGIPIQELKGLIETRVCELKSMGLESQHILAVHMPTSIHLITTLFAAIQIGAIFCPLNLRLPANAIGEQIQILQPKLFLTESKTTIFEATKKELLPSSFLLFTSGSSGAPKIVNLSLENFLAAARSANEICNFKACDTWLLSLPLFHVGGLSILFRALLSGGSVTTDPQNTAITHLSYVPTQLYRALPTHPHLKVILLSGAPIHHIPENLPIIAAYGMTETASMMTGQSNAPLKNGFYFLGFPHKNKEMRLNTSGEIEVRGDSLFQGYWDGSKLHVPDLWFPTGDLGQFDPDYGFAIVGRKDNQFISGGENIQPEEIEKQLLKFPSIIEAVVVPKMDPEYGQKPVAFLRTSAKLDKNSLKTHLLLNLPKYKIPSEFFSLDDACPQGLKPSRKKILEFLASK